MPPSSIDELLSAYLDNELSAEASEEIEQLLADDTRARERMQQMQHDWDMLDLLPTAEASQRFTQTTMEQAALISSQEAEQADGKAKQRNWWMMGAAAASVLLASLGGFAMVRQISTAGNRQLVHDIDLIENLDAYQQIENIKFLEDLEQSGLFDEVNEEAADEFPAS